MNSSIRIALVRAVPVKGDIAANQAILMRILGRIGRHRPDVVVTPECFLDGYVSTERGITRETIRDYAIDPDDSDAVEEVRSWAKRRHCWVILGCTRRVRGGAANSALVIDRRGRVVGAYDKIAIKGASAVNVPGKGQPVFDADFGRFGVMICADRHWPESVRNPALEGALIIFNPAYGGHGEMNNWLIRIRARESEIAVVFAHPLKSLVAAVDGRLLLDEASAEPPYSIAEVDLRPIARLRRDPRSRLNRARARFYRRAARRRG